MGSGSETDLLNSSGAGHVAGAASAGATPTLAEQSFRAPMPTTLDEKSTASRYANLDAATCKRMVKERNLAVDPVTAGSAGVTTGMRIRGPLHGVRISTPPTSSRFGIVDCRMVLVLDDLARHLSSVGIVAMSIDNIYRPHAKLPGKRKPSQHALGLALDVTRFVSADGRVMEPRHWGAGIGETACGPEAVMAEPMPDRISTRNLLCGIGREGLFHSILTPSYDAAHQTHFHMDIKEDKQSFRLY